MSKTRVLSAAHQDFLNAVDTYLNVSAELASDFVDHVEAAYKTIESNPRLFAKLDTNLPDREIRRLSLERFPYIIIYEMRATEPVVISIRHTSRQPI